MINIDIIIILDCQQLSLSSSPPTNGSYCPGIVNFTCRGTNVQVILDWKIDGSIVATYIVRPADGLPLRPADKFPLVVPPEPSAPEGFEVTILAAVLIDGSHLNITSVLRGNVADLRGSTVSCTDTRVPSSEQYYVEAQGK